MMTCLNQPQVLVITATILAVMGLIPGMPNFVFLFIASALGAIAYWKKKPPITQPIEPIVPEIPTIEKTDASWNDVTPIDTLGLEVGYRLIPLVDKAQQGDLLKRINGIRRKFAQEIGFLPPVIHIRDNLELRPNAYRITLKGSVIGQGESYSGMYLAINPGQVTMQLPGTATNDPAFGLPAVWIEAAFREQAQLHGYTVVDASTVVTTHINHLIHAHAAELLGRQELQKLLDHLNTQFPKLIEDLVPKLLPLSTVQKVLHNLLQESVHIRDMRTIIDVLTEHAVQTQDAIELTAIVRTALGRAILDQYYPAGSDVQVMSLHHELENILSQVMQTGAGQGAGIEPGLADTLLKEAHSAAQQQEKLGLPIVLLVPGAIRFLLARFLRRALPQLRVLAHSEIPDSRRIKITSVVGGNK
jgi:flagellar biosynthesis protein FlhA